MMVCKVSKFINGFTVGIDNVSKAFLDCFSTRNCPEKKDERYQIAESISTESKYFHDFQAIADQFRFLDKTKGTIPKLHCPEEEAERYQESNPSESNYGHGVKNNADQDLSIDLEIKGTNPKLHCPEEEAERYQESNPSESNYGHGLKTNADQDLSIDLEIKGTSPKLQLQCPEEERCEDPEFDLKEKGISVLTLYDYETNKMHQSEKEDAEQLKRKTECKEEKTASKEVETKVKNEGSDEVQNCPVSSSKQEMVITKPLKGENACNEGTGVAKQFKGKKEVPVANQLKGKKEVLNQVKEKIEDNDADETMNYDGKSCPKEMTGEKQIEEKGEQMEVMAKAKEEEDENECNGEMNVAKQIKVKEGRKTNTCYDIDNGKMTKVKQIKCKNKCSGEMTIIAKHLVGRKNGINEMSFGKHEKENTENNNVNEIENCNSKSCNNIEGGKQRRSKKKSKSTEKTAMSKIEDKNKEKLANEIQIPISTCYNPNNPEAKQLNGKNECNEEMSVAKQEKIGKMNIADDIENCHSTSYNNQSVESKQMDGKIECDEGKTTAKQICKKNKCKDEMLLTRVSHKKENKMADAINAFHGTCSNEEMAVKNQLEEKYKCSEEVASLGGNKMEQIKGNNKCNDDFEFANQVREKIENKDGDEIMNCHSPSFDKESAEAMQLKRKMKWNEEKQLDGKNVYNKGVAKYKQMDEVSECGGEMNIAKQGKNESKGEVNEVKKIKENDKGYEEINLHKNMESKKEQPVPEEILVSKQVEEENGEKVTLKTKRITNEDNETQSVKKMSGEKNKVKKAVETKRSCVAFNEEKSTAAAIKSKEKKDVNVFNTNKNDYAETTKDSKGKKENAFVKKDDQVEDVRKRNDAQNKRMTLAKHREGKSSFDFGQWLKFFSVLANPFLFILLCLAGGAIASGDGYLITREVLNASDPFIGPDRCNIQSEKLQCNHREIKACIPDINGSMWVVCTGNFLLTVSAYHKQNILDTNYLNPKKAYGLKMADMSDELHILTQEIKHVL